MRTLALIAALGIFAPPAALRAEEPAKAPAQAAPRAKPSALRLWFKHFKEGLAESSVSQQYQKKNLTAVAAVRGAQQEAAEPNKPQWKGGSRAKKAEQLKKEKAELSSAVDMILDGKVKEGEAGLDAFEKAHPKSPLLSDVHQARDKAKELEASPASELAEKPAQGQ